MLYIFFASCSYILDINWFTTNSGMLCSSFTSNFAIYVIFVVLSSYGELLFLLIRFRLMRIRPRECVLLLFRLPQVYHSLLRRLQPMY